MADPYRILGVSRGSSDDEIKAAYRKKAAELSSDNYAGNPLSDIAQQKMDELNAAYDQIMSDRRIGAAGQKQSYRNTNNSGYQGYQGHSNNMFYDIRQLLNANNVVEAENRLLAMPQNQRGAEWHYLMGNVCYAKGWLNEANQYYATAAQMEPGNGEYAAAKNRMNAQRGGNAAGNPYGGYQTNNTSGGGCSGCDICTGLVCADCCCECMGGDLIRCC